MKINPEKSTALKKDIMRDIKKDEPFAILSSIKTKELAVLLVLPDAIELYQIKTIAALPLKKGVDKDVAERFYKEQILAIVQLIKDTNVKMAILDYNLSFWAYKKQPSIASFLITNSDLEVVWANAKTKLRKEDEIKPNKDDKLTDTGKIALSLLYSYLPDKIKETIVFNEDLDSAIEQQRNKFPERYVVPFEDVFDTDLSESKKKELDALIWGLHKTTNKEYAESFEKMIDRISPLALQKNH